MLQREQPRRSLDLCKLMPDQEFNSQYDQGQNKKQ